MNSAAAVKLTAYVCPKLSAAASFLEDFIRRLEDSMRELSEKRGSISDETYMVEMQAYKSLINLARRVLDDTNTVDAMICTTLNPDYYTLYRALRILDNLLDTLQYGRGPRLPASIKGLIYEVRAHILRTIKGGGSGA
ncbi:MAG: hypothetical protein GXO09_01750 [Crenarchaeota archaeon]|nr:hypothetical protein [Thermoproteota archaeon]